MTISLNDSLKLQEVPYLGQRSLNSYERWKAIKVEKKRLEARIKELDEAAKNEDDLLRPQFGVGAHYRRLPGGILLERKVVVVPPKIITPAMVGTIAIKGYEYPKYMELEG